MCFCFLSASVLAFYFFGDDAPVDGVQSVYVILYSESDDMVRVFFSSSSHFFVEHVYRLSFS